MVVLFVALQVSGSLLLACPLFICQILPWIQFLVKLTLLLVITMLEGPMRVPQWRSAFDSSFGFPKVNIKVLLIIMISDCGG